MATFTKDEYAAIGEMIVEAAAVDTAMSILVLQVGALSKTSLTRLTLGEKLAVLAECLPPLLRNDVNREYLAELVKAIRSTNNKRNIVIHGTWRLEVIGALNSAPLNTMMLNGSVRKASAHLREGTIEMAEVKQLTARYLDHKKSLVMLYLMAFGEGIAGELRKRLPNLDA
jgi:hypothetical protein